MRYLVVIPGVLAACSKAPPQPADFGDFVATKAGAHAARCSDQSDDKRFSVAGYLQLPSSLSISDGQADLDLYESVDASGKGKGRSFPVLVKVPGDIDDLWSTATEVKTAGYRFQKGKIDADALRIHASNGVATAADPLDLVIEVKAIRQYQTNAITACRYAFVEATRRAQR